MTIKIKCDPKFTQKMLQNKLQVNNQQLTAMGYTDNLHKHWLHFILKGMGDTLLCHLVSSKLQKIKIKNKKNMCKKIIRAKVMPFKGTSFETVCKVFRITIQYDFYDCFCSYCTCPAIVYLSHLFITLKT